MKTHYLAIIIFGGNYLKTSAAYVANKYTVVQGSPPGSDWKSGARATSSAHVSYQVCNFYAF